MYKRQNLITLHLPPLRERRGDIELLARAFLASAATTHGRPDLALEANGHREDALWWRTGRPA